MAWISFSLKCTHKLKFCISGLRWKFTFSTGRIIALRAYGIFSSPVQFGRVRKAGKLPSKFPTLETFSQLLEQWKFPCTHFRPLWNSLVSSEQVLKLGFLGLTLQYSLYFSGAWSSQWELSLPKMGSLSWCWASVWSGCILQASSFTADPYQAAWD